MNLSKLQNDLNLEPIAVSALERLLQLFDTFGEIVHVVSDVDICRDKKDNFLLALAKDGQANYLITGDSDLLIIKQFENTEILTYTAFEMRFRK